MADVKICRAHQTLVWERLRHVRRARSACRSPPRPVPEPLPRIGLQHARELLGSAAQATPGSARPGPQGGGGPVALALGDLMFDARGVLAIEVVRVDAHGGWAMPDRPVRERKEEIQ